MNDLLNNTSHELPEYGPTEAKPAPATRARRRKPMKRAKPTHYKVICISMYTRDLEELDEKVAELKRRGFTKANKSQMIRLALDRLDLNKELGIDPDEEFALAIGNVA
ncbi:MAG: hypothetical protein AB7T06_33710 [Kofleriaceae bacterium]